MKGQDSIVTTVTTTTDEQGVDSISELLNLDDGNMENLCKVLQRRGSQSNSGNPDLGVKVSAHAEENLRLTTFYCRHQERVSRTLL